MLLSFGVKVFKNVVHFTLFIPNLNFFFILYILISTQSFYIAPSEIHMNDIAAIIITNPLHLHIENRSLYLMEGES